MRTTLKMNIKDIEQMLNSRYVNKHKKILTTLMQGVMLEADAWGKQSAPWNDRTGLARLSTGAKASSKKDKIIGKMYINVWYGKFLEFDHGGRYKVVKPMFYKSRQRINSGLKQLGYKGSVSQSI